MKREIRSSSIAGVAGAGAIVDVGQESFLVPGIDQWRQQQLAVVQLCWRRPKTEPLLRVVPTQN